MTVFAERPAAYEHIHGICLKTGPPRRVSMGLRAVGSSATRVIRLPVTADRIAAAVAAFGAEDRDRDRAARTARRPGFADKRGPRRNAVRWGVDHRTWRTA